MKICFIINPNAGGVGGIFQKEVGKAADQLAHEGCAVRRLETKAKGHATTLARQAAADGFDIAVAVGGDGTVNEVCNGLAGTDTAMAVLPAGTANVYAADLGIPIWSLLKPEAVAEGVAIITTGRRRRIDLGCARRADGASRYFLMWCGIGLDAAITHARHSTSQVRELNFASWAVASVMVAFDFMGTRATLVTDNATVKKRVLMAVVSNGQLYGRLWRMAPEAKMDDGLLDVAVMTGHHWPSTIKHLVGLTLRQHVKDPDFHLYRTTRLFLTAKEALPVHVDAEPFGATPVEIEVVPAALEVIVPHHAPARLFVSQTRRGD
ncbi:MAG: diacylglycerol kinase family lipid kinase [Anaerolineae bacterium]|nr:diacylglycerol kinase family lipid kinase [Anaerolineae bacterium]